MPSESSIREAVRANYARAASEAATQAAKLAANEAANEAACCGPSCCTPKASNHIDIRGDSYGAADLAAVPVGAVAISRGCGNPTAVADLAAGETVLDLGSGGGIDVLLAARRVGPTGKVYGLDMTQEMLDLARRNAAEAGAHNVEFLEGYIESIPLPDASVDVVISNCVINLSADKPTVFAEVNRVLRPGGRLGVTDVVADDALSPEERAERGAWVGCIAGALSFAEYRSQLTEAGFSGISLTPTHEVTPGMSSVIVKASRPAG